MVYLRFLIVGCIVAFPIWFCVWFIYDDARKATVAGIVTIALLEISAYYNSKILMSIVMIAMFLACIYLSKRRRRK